MVYVGIIITTAIYRRYVNTKAFNSFHNETYSYTDIRVLCVVLPFENVFHGLFKKATVHTIVSYQPTVVHGLPLDVGSPYAMFKFYSIHTQQQQNIIRVGVFSATQFPNHLDWCFTLLLCVLF